MSILRKPLPFLIAIAALVCAGTASAQGLYWETDNTGGKGGPQKAQFWAMPKMMKIAADDGNVVILRSDQDKLISIDNKAKSYWEMPFAELEAMSKQMQTQMEGARAEMQAKMKDLPPEQRAMVEKMMGKMQGGAEKEPNVDVKATAESKKIEGFACTKYVATEDGKTILTAWTTNDIPAFAPMRADFVALQRRLNATNRTFRSGLSQAYEKIDGFPMETQTDTLKSVVTKVEPKAIAASEFEPPAGYKKEAPPMPQKPK
jgi:GLPGLI family protein